MRKFLMAAPLLLAACAPAPRAPAPPAPAPAGPAEAYRVESSALEVRAYRAGPLAALGHDHLIGSGALRGRIELREPRSASGFRLELPLQSLVVDDPAARAAAGGGFAAPVPDPDRDATRRNLLGPAQLDAAAQPVLTVESQSLQPAGDGWRAQVRVGLRGTTRLLTVPVTIAEAGGRLSVASEFRVSHADLGLSPFSVALGALRVADGIDVRLRLEAVREVAS